jgi:hypothetical protein
MCIGNTQNTFELVCEILIIYEVISGFGLGRSLCEVVGCIVENNIIPGETVQLANFLGERHKSSSRRVRQFLLNKGLSCICLGKKRRELKFIVHRFSSL